MKKRSDYGMKYYAVGIFALLAAGILMLVVFGANVYNRIVDFQFANNDRRAVLSYLSTSIRSCDNDGAVSVGRGPEGDSLVLSSTGEDGYVYELRIYLYRGNLMEEYQESGTAYDPESAQPIGKTDTFSVALKEGNVRISTSQGNVLVHLRSEEADEIA